jgi:hypothetical protein
MRDVSLLHIRNGEDYMLARMKWITISAILRLLVRVHRKSSRFRDRQEFQLRSVKEHPPEGRRRIPKLPMNP